MVRLHKRIFVSISLIAALLLPTFSIAQSYGCISVPAGLSLGSRSSGVLSLQQFLVAQNYPGGGSWMQTGYFGQATAAALRSFQASRGLPQTGWVDAGTAAAISAASCPGYSTYSGYGYTSSYPLNTYSYAPYSYNYNSHSNTLPYSYPNYPTYPSYPTYDNCLVGQGSSYTYGGYNYNCPVRISSLSRTSGEVGDRVTVYGSGFSSSGNTVRFGVGVAARNISASDGGTRLTFTVPTYLDVYTYGRERVYETTYPISVVNSRGYTSNSASFRVTDTDNEDNDDLEITSISGPSSLDTGEEGLWTVRVSGGSSDYYTFSVDWDDDTSFPYYPYYPYPYAQAQDFFQTNRLTHTYYSSGTYDIRFTVRDRSGDSDTATKTVRVSGDSSDAHEVSIDDDRFSPSTIYVSRGTTVEWTNDDNEDHTVTSDYDSFDSGRLDPDETYRRTFNTPGAYPYHCELHPEMRGIVVVR